MTEIVCIIITALFAVGATAAVLLYRSRTIKIMRSLDRMIDKAIDGRFTEDDFDESMLSAVEAKMAKYLSASEHSAIKTAEEKEKIKGLISDISHQTKTPISNIRLYSELLGEQELDSQARDCAEAIENQAEKLSFLIDSLVKLSRLETGIISLSPIRRDIVPMLENVYRQYLPKAEDKGLKFTLEAASAEAVIDEKWASEALGNIVDNAIKYTSSGYVSVSVKEYELFCAVLISDSGAGIPEEEQSRIFTRFYRSQSVSQQEGSGIGLYLAREIVSGCGGYIKVSSEIGKGTTFSVFFAR